MLLEVWVILKSLQHSLLSWIVSTVKVCTIVKIIIKMFYYFHQVNHCGPTSNFLILFFVSQVVFGTFFLISSISQFRPASLLSVSSCSPCFALRGSSLSLQSCVTCLASVTFLLQFNCDCILCISLIPFLPFLMELGKILGRLHTGGRSIQESPAFWKFALHHFAFTKDLY